MTFLGASSDGVHQPMLWDEEGGPCEGKKFFVFLFVYKTRKMGGKMKIGLSYAKNFLTTGALVETSPRVEREICKHVPTGENAIVIEYGMGYGNITRKILDKLPPTGKLYAFEVNKEFCDHVRKTIKDERLIVINDSAENLKLNVEGKVDAVISSLPFSLIAEEKRTKIIQHSNDLLAEGAHFSQVLLSPFYQKTFQNGFGNCLLVKLPDFPVYYIYHSEKRSSRIGIKNAL